MSLIIGDILGAFTFSGANALFGLLDGNQDKMRAEEKRFNDPQIKLEQDKFKYQQNFLKKNKSVKENKNKHNKVEISKIRPTKTYLVFWTFTHHPTTINFTEAVQVTMFGTTGYVGYRILRKIFKIS